MLIILAALLTQAPAQSPFDSLKFRNIGPATPSGRIDDFAVLESNPAIFYVASATGVAPASQPQTFVARSDMGCGSTIGPISAARAGIRTVDVGNPMLSMHSCREMAAVADVEPMISVLRAFFETPLELA